MCFIAPTCDTIVCVPRFSVSWSGAFEFCRELHREPLRRKLDRRQRILDLVRQPPRDFGPRGIALRLHQFGHVVEDHDVAAGDRRARQRAFRASAASATGSPRRVPPPSAIGRRGRRESLRRPVRRTTPSPGAACPSPPSGMPISSASGCCRITAALGLTVRSRCRSSNASTPDDRLPRMLSRYARVVSVARRLSSALPWASASCAVIVLNDSVSTPSSSRDTTGWRRVKSPCATARVPSASSPRGAAKRSDSTTARPSAVVSASSSVRMQRQLVEPLQALPQQREFAIVAHAGRTRSASCASALRHGLDHLQQLERIGRVVGIHGHHDAHRQAAVAGLLDLLVRLLQPRQAQGFAAAAARASRANRRCRRPPARRRSA